MDRFWVPLPRPSKALCRPKPSFRGAAFSEGAPAFPCRAAFQPWEASLVLQALGGDPRRTPPIPPGADRAEEPPFGPGICGRMPWILDRSEESPPGCFWN
jgi:hypothetical protein